MKKSGNTFIYINRWPSFLDLEELLYRPLILKVLPAVLGFICKIFDKAFDFCVGIVIKIGTFFARIFDNITDILAKVLPAVASTICGVLDILTDGLVVVLRKTIYKDSKKRGELEEGNEFTHIVGSILNEIEYLLNKTIWKNHTQKKDLEHWIVLKYAAFKENTTVIERSLSYGLVVFCLGLCATLIYLLVSAFL